MAVIAAVLVLPTLLDAYKLSEGQFDPLIDQSGQIGRSTDDDTHVAHAHQTPPVLTHGTEIAEHGRSLPRPSRTAETEPRLAAPAERTAVQPSGERVAVERLAFLQRVAGLRIEGLQQRLEAERTRSMTLAGDLAAVRIQIARGFRDRVAASSHNGDESMLVGARLRRAAESGVGDDTLPSMSIRLNIGPTDAVLAEDDARRAASDPAMSDPADRKRDLRAGVDAAALSLTPAARAPSMAGLPERQQTRVVIEYARGDGSARERALKLGDALRSKGLDVGDPVDTRNLLPQGGVTYHYKTDRVSAERIAGLFGSTPPIRGSLPARGRLPRPGTIEIAVTNRASRAGD